MSEYSYPKSSRLLSAQEFTAVFERNQYKVANRHFLILALQHSAASSRLGTIVAKKNIAKAVQRNRLKRLIRDSFRHKKAALESLDLVVLVRKGADSLCNKEVSSSLSHLWQDLQKKTLSDKHGLKQC